MMDYSVNGSVINLKAGQGLFVNSNCLHYGFSDNRCECHFLCILLHPTLLSANRYFIETVLDPITMNTEIPYIKLKPSCSWQNDIILEMIKIEKQAGKENDALIIIQSFISILSSVVSNIGKVIPSHQESDEISSLTVMIGYIQKHYTESTSIKELATVGKCCKTRCNDLFRKYLNMTPLNYMTEYRLDKSTDLLVNTTISITEIAYSCGFSGSSYYCEIFKKYYGLTPKQYRSAHLSTKD